MTELDKIESRVAVCNECRLCTTAINKVFGEGNPRAACMIVGEAPGREENSAGRPFVGDAGKLLDKAFDKLSVSRPDFFIANILKCWPPGNSLTTDIKQDCIPICIKFLEDQIEAIRPKIIIALGATSMQRLVDIHSSIGKMRGKVMAGPCETLVLPTWHPAYILRCGGMSGSRQKQKRAAKEFIEDMKTALGIAGITWVEKK
jgi:DNA polymerase